MKDAHRSTMGLTRARLLMMVLDNKKRLRSASRKPSSIKNLFDGVSPLYSRYIYIYIYMYIYQAAAEWFTVDLKGFPSASKLNAGHRYT